MTYLLNAPLITDWISSIASIIGIPLALWSFLKLVTKDKDKQWQLNSLSEMAKNQNDINLQLKDQVIQLTKQTGEFQYQSTLMFESNKLLEKQVQILNDYFVDRQISEKAKQDLERQKRLLEIKPHFIFNNSVSNPAYFELKLKNKGSKANDCLIERTDSEFVTLQDINPKSVIENEEILTISGCPNINKTYLTGNTVNFGFKLLYKDVDGNEYFQNIVRQYQKYIIDSPVSK